MGASPVRGAASIDSTAAIPSTTRPNAVYTPSSAADDPVQMKNDVVALSAASPRAIETAVLRLSRDNMLTFPWIKERVDKGGLAVEAYHFDIHDGVLSKLGERGLEPVV